MCRCPTSFSLPPEFQPVFFILSKNRDGKDGEHRERKEEILFIDASKLDHTVSRGLRAFEEQDLSRIAGTYLLWCNLGGTYADVEGYCKAASLAEVEANNYVLSSGRYVGSGAEEEDGMPFEEKMKTLTTELADQFKEGAVLEQRIRENLESIGFGFKS